jgi:hypothetical protein
MDGYNIASIRRARVLLGLLICFSLALSACNFPSSDMGTVSREEALESEDAEDDTEDEDDDTEVVISEEESGFNVEDTFGAQCPEIGDQLYFLLAINWSTEIGPITLYQRTFREIPYVLDVKEFNPYDHPTGDVVIDDTSIYQPGFSHYTEAIIGEMVWSGYGDIDVSVHGYCENSNIYLYVTETWHDYTVYSPEAGPQLLYGWPEDTHIAGFNYYEVMSESGDIDPRTLDAMFSGQHAWQLFGHYNNACDTADILSSDQPWNFPIPIPESP